MIIRPLSLLLFLLLAIVSSCKKMTETSQPMQNAFIRGADFSFLPEIEDYSVMFYNASWIAEDPLEIMKKAGSNAIRIRLWHNPESGHSGLAEVEGFAGRIRSKGMKVWLCVHYSDNWADPGKQTPPGKWQALDLAALKDSVHEYTKLITGKIQPDIIQIGNEVNGGFLWELGRITNGDNFYQLLREGARAVREISPGCQIMIHFAGITGAEGFFHQLGVHQVDYDLIGLSYYPVWHGKDLDSLSALVTNLGEATNKKVLIAETAYPWTFDWNDWTNNVIGSSNQILTEYAATPQGQKDYLSRVREILENDSNGLGFCYWGGEFIAFKGTQAMDGSSWENQALFDFENRALPVIDVFANDHRHMPGIILSRFKIHDSRFTTHESLFYLTLAPK